MQATPSSARDPGVPARSPAIARNPAEAATEAFDLAIVGGGIYGVMLTIEAVRRGLRPVLLERDDFGGATTFNHLRTLHGGLRYLQSLDLPRFFESVAERGWFLRRFPDATGPLACLMPLYGDGLRRPSVLRLALALNDGLSLRRNAGAPPGNRLPGGRIVPPAAVMDLAPGIREDGLRGGAVWHDAVMQAPQRLVMELLRQACANGAVALNHCPAGAVETANGRIAGVRAQDAAGGGELLFRAPVAINAAGPWGPDWLSAQGLDGAGLFPAGLLLWNVAFDRPASFSHALALTPGRGGQTYFLHAWQGRVLAGTGEMAADGPGRRGPGPSAMQAFLADLDAAFPALGARSAPILRVYSGLLPATPSGELSRRPALVDHAERGGPAGLYSVSGVKFTTARRVADGLLGRIFPKRVPTPWPALAPAPPPPHPGRFDLGGEAPPAVDAAEAEALAALARDESAELSDLVLRRTNLGEHPAYARAAARPIAAAMTPDPAAGAEALRRLDAELDAATDVGEDGTR